MTPEQIAFYNIPTNLQKLDEIDPTGPTLFVEVVLSAPAIPRRFPLRSKILETGVRDFTNEEITEPQYMSHIALQDAVVFQGFSYRILSGVMFTERNYKI